MHCRPKHTPTAHSTAPECHHSPGFSALCEIAPAGSSLNSPLLMRCAESGGVTPLHLASGAGHVDVVEWLLRSGKAQIGRRDAKGNTALHHAAMGGCLRACKALVRAGVAGGRNWEGKGYTPLELAKDQTTAEWLGRNSGTSFSATKQR